LKATVLLAYKTRERDALLILASDIVAAVKQRSRALTRGEDAMVAEFKRKAQALDQEIQSLQGDASSRNLRPQSDGRQTALAD